MPVPMPMGDEKQNKFMGRCMHFMAGENSKKPSNQRWTNQQMVAICFSQWDKKGKSRAGLGIDDEERKADEEFVAKFLKKYPQYKIYFEPETEE